MSSSVQGPVPRARRPSQEQWEWAKWRSLLVPTVSQERRGDRSVPIEVRCGVNTPGQLVGNCCLPATGVVSLPLSPSVSPPCKPDKSLWRHSKNSEPLSRSHTVRSYSRERLSTIVPGDPYESLEAALPDLLLPPLPPSSSLPASPLTFPSLVFSFYSLRWDALIVWQLH